MKKVVLSYRLTHPQKRIWYIEQIDANSALHNIGGCLNIHENIDVEIIKKSINYLIKNNDGLRLRINESSDEPSQYLADFEEENIDFLDFSSNSHGKEEFKSWSNNLFKNSFKLENSKLYYFAIYKLDEKHYGVLLNIHHIISDGWSISLIERELCDIYVKLKNGEEIEKTTCSYLDFITEEYEYEKSVRFLKNRKFWQEKFANLPKEFLYNTSNTLDGARKSFEINKVVSAKINKFIKEKKCSLNTFFISLLIIYINKTTYKNDIVIGNPVFNRTSKEQKKMIGMFTSTVPFRFKLDESMNIDQLMKQVNRELKLCLLNQKYPYDLLINDLELSKQGYDSLFKMCLNYYNSKYENNIDGIKADVTEYYCGKQSYSLQLTVKEWEEEKITLNFDYKTKEYSSTQIKAMYKALLNIAENIIADENICIKAIKLLSEEESKYKLYDLNSTSHKYPQKTVYELFEEQVCKIPNMEALKFEDKTLTYRELNEKSNQFANYLREKGIGKGSIVAITETHSLELMISILGVIKAGAAYLPMDPSYPAERINYMLDDSKSNMLLSNFKIADEIKFDNPIINVKEIDTSQYSKENLTKVNDLNDLVYIIYTSGSTGKPKGVLLEHKGLTNYVCWASKTYFDGERETMPLYSSISFDLTVTTIFTPLISGNRIIIYDKDESEFVLYKISRENESTVVKLTPAHLTLLKDMDNTSSKIKKIIVGGEDLKVKLAKEVSKSFWGKIDICNEYGPTETVVGCMIYIYNEESDRKISVPIGIPADNVQIYILDKYLEPVITETIGELYISGDGVARGYLNREDLTKERFIENPFIPGKRMYKTGDTARYLENGVIEYAGRIDNQVKIRGHRIELGEIEKYLLENELIKDAVVVCSEDAGKNKILNAYVVAKGEISVHDLRGYLLNVLPKYMVPNSFVKVDEIPLTVNGKVNYSLLPEPKKVERNFVKYSTELEENLVNIMEDILAVDEISMNDNYYELGGDSIKAIQISSKLKSMGLRITVKDILACDSIAEIAASIDENVNLINQNQCEGVISKTPISEWFFKQKLNDKNFYNQYILLEYQGRLELDKVKKAVNALVNHHDGLRINYDSLKKEMYYNNQLDDFDKVEYFDFSDAENTDLQHDIEEVKDKLNESINLNEGSLFKAAVIQLKEDKQVLLFAAHHLIVDGVSWRIISTDFFTILQQLDNNVEIKLPLKTNSFKEWSEAIQYYSAKNDFSEETKYWQSIMNKDMNIASHCSLEKENTENSELITREIDEETLDKLISKGNEIYGMNINEVLTAVLAISLSKLSNNKEVTIELEGHGRKEIDNNLDISRTVGWFTSMYPASFTLENENLEDNIKALKEQLRGIPNDGFNYSIIKYLRNDINSKGDKFVRFNYLGDFENIVDQSILNIKSVDFGLASSNRNDLTALIEINAVKNKTLKIILEYSTKNFKHETMEKFIEDYIETINSILYECCNKQTKEFTPSDFDDADISQEDLDGLFQ